MKIILASDHAGFELKEKLAWFLRSIGHEAVDKGPAALNEHDDYPDFVAEAAKEVSAAALSGNLDVRGIVMGGSGQGEAIVANKFPGIRAAVFYGRRDPKEGRDFPDPIFLARSHNDSNILSLGARFLTFEEAESAVREWLETPFSGEKRHLRRINKIAKLEKEL